MIQKEIGYKAERVIKAINDFIVAYYIKNASIPSEKEIEMLANAIV